jgi:hypothetical protein
VFGYASLVAVPEPGALPGRLHGYRRFWGAAMNNWEGGEGAKHFLDRESGERPRIRVAYLDVKPSEGSVVNGVAIPVDAARLSAFDAREVNYERVEVTGAFEVDAGSSAEAGETAPGAGDRVSMSRVFAYVGLDAARARCRQGAAEGNICVSRDYAAGVRLAFERLGPDALAEFDRTTEPLPFPERDLRVVLPNRLKH